MNNYTEIEYEIGNGDTTFLIGEGIVNYQNVACQLYVPDYVFNEKTTFLIQESNSGLVWSDIVDNLGNPLSVDISASGKFMLKTSIFYARFIRAKLTAGVTPSTGTLSINTYFKDKNT